MFPRRQDFQESWEQGERQEYYRQIIINNNNSYKSDLKFTILAMTTWQRIGADIIMINNLKQVGRRKPGETSSRDQPAQELQENQALKDNQPQSDNKWSSFKFPSFVYIFLIVYFL